MAAAPSAVILEPKERKSVTASTIPLSICHEVMGTDVTILVFWMLSLSEPFHFSFLYAPTILRALSLLRDTVMACFLVCLLNYTVQSLKAGALNLQELVQTRFLVTICGGNEWICEKKYLHKVCFLWLAGRVHHDGEKCKKTTKQSKTEKNQQRTWSLWHLKPVMHRFYKT